MKFVGGLVLLRPIPSIPFLRSVMRITDRWPIIDTDPRSRRPVPSILVIDRISRRKNIKEKMKRNNRNALF